MLLEFTRIDSEDDFLPWKIEVESLPAVIGRSGDADILLDDRWVSRWHCKLLISDGQLVVLDLGSKHGTWLNGKAISESPLHSGDVLTVGLSAFSIEIAPECGGSFVGQEDGIEVPADAADSWGDRFRQLFPPPTFY